MMRTRNRFKARLAVFAAFHALMADAGAGDGGGGAGADAGKGAEGGAGGDKTGGAFKGQNVTVQNDLGESGTAGASVQLADKTAENKDAAAAPDFKTQLGDYAKDPAFANFSDVPGMAKALKEAQGLVGKKLGIPTEASTPEEKAAFYTALGVPKDAEGYGLKKPEGLPEVMNKLYDESILPGFAKTAHELNLTPAQAAGLQKWYDGMSAEQMKEIQDGSAAADEAYEAEAVKVFGTKEKAEAAQQQARVVLEKYVSPELRASMKDMPNNALLAVATALSGLSKDMTGEDKALGGDGADGKFGGKSVAELREQGRKLQASPAAQNAFDPKHKETQAEIKAVYEQIARIEQAGAGRRK